MRASNNDPESQRHRTTTGMRKLHTISTLLASTIFAFGCDLSIVPVGDEATSGNDEAEEDVGSPVSYGTKDESDEGSMTTASPGTFSTSGSSDSGEVPMETSPDVTTGSAESDSGYEGGKPDPSAGSAETASPDTDEPDTATSGASSDSAAPDEPCNGEVGGEAGDDGQPIQCQLDVDCGSGRFQLECDDTECVCFFEGVVFNECTINQIAECSTELFETCCDVSVNL